MTRRILTLAGIILSYLAITAFTVEDTIEVSSPVGWSALGLALLLIFILALALIYQQRQTPGNVARYHLDHTDDADASHTPQAPSDAGESDRGEEGQEPEPAPEPVGVAPDDLKIVEGIGPKIEEILKSNGINTLAQLASSDPEQLRQVLAAAGPRFSLADPTSWPEQAGYLVAGDHEKFQQLTDTLKGGRQGD